MHVRSPASLLVFLVFFVLLAGSGSACSSDSPPSTPGGSSGSSGSTDGGGGGSIIEGGGAGRPDNPTACGATDAAGVRGCVSKDRYTEDVTFIAGDMRAPGSPHARATGDRCAAVLSAHGFTVERHAYGSGTNIVGTLPGTTAATEVVVAGAHYDHLDGCLGADDNATGVAGMLELARVLSGHTHPRTLVVACWDEEERGEIGSRAWVKRAKSTDTNVVQYVNFDMIGYAKSEPNSQQMPSTYKDIYRKEYAALEARQFKGDFLWTFYDKRSRPFVRALEEQSAAVSRAELGVQVPTALLSRVELQNTDHAGFWAAGFPAAHIGDTGDLRNPNYHCKQSADTLATLDHDYAADIVRAATAATWTMLEGKAPAAEPGPGVASCTQFCARASSFGAKEGACMKAVFDVLGVQPPASCASVTSPASCNTCAADLKINDLQCEGLADLCL
ncbi:MAG: M20/M25/M40 family metallo-hydrolase [Labilithrix sp.]|nr:M20/M25/M40 family metallo-hydrolase [Labilithrix sp.]MCW5817896.1 M20/M25/M40 family metallo-hydrolase [Labilithrix sp.]